MESFLDTCNTADMDVMQFLEKGLEASLWIDVITKVDGVRLNHYLTLFIYTSATTLEYMENRYRWAGIPPRSRTASAILALLAVQTCIS